MTDDFDHDALYYRVLGDGGDYVHRDREPEQIAGDAPAHDHPFYEFDDLRRVGRWLFLGDRVLVLRVPPDAQVEENHPMSQGGCMAYSASRIEKLGVLSMAELMRTYDAAGLRPSTLHLAHQTFDDALTLPARGVEGLYLDHCRGHVDLSHVRETLSLFRCDLEVQRLPGRLSTLRAVDCRFTGVADLPAAEQRTVKNCTFA